jgi:hypothetical protein
MLRFTSGVELSEVRKFFPSCSMFDNLNVLIELLEEFVIAEGS